MHECKYPANIGALRIPRVGGGLEVAFQRWLSVQKFSTDKIWVMFTVLYRTALGFFASV